MIYFSILTFRELRIQFDIKYQNVGCVRSFFTLENSRISPGKLKEEWSRSLKSKKFEN